MGSKYYKEKALGILKGNWWREIGYFMVILVAQVIIQSITRRNDSVILAFVVGMMIFPLTVGYARHMMELARGIEPQGIGDLFTYYTTSEVVELFLLNIVVNIIVLLWTILFIIPGIIASFAYVLTLYIKIDNPDKSIGEVMKESVELMRGKKMDYFVISLTFIGWMILGALALGIGIIPATIYMTLSLTIFVVDILDGRKEEENIEVTNETEN